MSLSHFRLINFLTSHSLLLKMKEKQAFDAVIVHRCLVGDVSGKSYGDVAFIEHHSLQANILSKIYKRAILKEYTGALLYSFKITLL